MTYIPDRNALLRDRIEHNRCQLLELAAQQGMQHHEVIKESQSLDKLLDEYYRYDSWKFACCQVRK